jgi:glycosyltransferase involved in cell wall biosynthesis
MTAMPQVSIITPILNAASFLDEAIASVAAQTYSDWELLLCDDGSTDASVAIARRHMASHPRKIKYLEHPGHVTRGSSAARNLGLHNARGRFIALLDADDVWLPNKLDEQVPLLERHSDAGMLYGDTLRWFSWTGNPDDAHRDFQLPLGVPLDQLSNPPDLLTRYLDRRAEVACTCSILARRDIVERVGGFEESFRGMYDDQAFYAKMILAAPVYVSSRLWDKYRIHPGSMCARAEQSEELGRAQRQYLEWLERYVTAHQCRGTSVWRALQAEKWRARHPVLTRIDRAIRIRLGLVSRPRRQLRLS